MHLNADGQRSAMDRAIIKKHSIMRTLSLLLLLPCLAFSQDIRLDLRQTPLDKAIRRIESQTSYRFVFSQELLTHTKPVTLQWKGSNIRPLLDTLFYNQPASYQIDGQFIILRAREIQQQDNAGGVIVQGRVLGDKDEPLVGVSIVSLVVNAHAFSNAKGMFRLEGIPPGTSIRFSCIGYQSQDIIIGNNRQLLIRLQLQVNTLEETVVKGYYSSTRVLNTGSVATVKEAQIITQPVDNPLATLQGRVPGVYIQQSNGLPGSAYTIQIRGQNSLRNQFTNNGNLPLYVIDGVPYESTPLGNSFTSAITQGGNPLSNISPADIASIDILKDADATAIYGSRGANGVVLITTKRAQATQLSASIDAWTGWGKVTRTMPLLPTTNYLTMRKEAFANDGATPDPGIDYDLLNWDSARNTDWQKALLGGTARSQHLAASLASGNANVHWLVGTVLDKQTTVFPGNFSDQRASVFMNLNASSEDKKFNAAFSANYLSDKNQLLQNDLLGAALVLPPNAPAGYTSSGSLNWEPGFQNPYASLEQSYRGITHNLIGSGLLSYELIKGLTAKLNLGMTYSSLDEQNLIPLRSFNPADGLASGYSLFGTTKSSSWIAEPQFEFTRSIGQGRLRALAGTSFHSQSRSMEALDAEGFSSDALLSNIAAAATLYTLAADNTDYRYQAVFLRLNYDWKSRWLLNLTGRRDGSSRFGPGKQFANFGALGAGWIFSRERLFEKWRWLNLGKLRASYGTTGSDQIGDYRYLSTWKPTTYAYQGPALYPSILSNPNYSWETNQKAEAALELSLFNNAINFTAAWYRNQSSNQLVGYALPGATGFTSVTANLPATVINTGWEFGLSSTLLNNKNWNCNVSLTASFPKNTLRSFPNLAASSYASLYVVGKSLGVQQRFHYTGVDPATGLQSFASSGGNSSFPNYPGDLFPYTDVRQKAFGGIFSSLRYKNWQLDWLLQWVKQTGLNAWSADFIVPGQFGNQPDIVMGRWQKPGDQTSIQQFTQSYASAAYAAYNAPLSDQAVSDASFIRLKNIALNWNLPTAWRHRLHLGDCYWFVRAQNLVTITSYFGLDPENQSFTHLPPLKQWVTGIHFNF